MSEEKKIYKVDAVIRPEKLEELKDKLYKIGVTGITVTEVYGCGLTRGQEEIYRGSVLYVNLLPKIKVEIVIYETPLDTLIDTIRGVCNTGHVGDGKIFVSELYTAMIRPRNADKFIYSSIGIFDVIFSTGKGN